MGRPNPEGPATRGRRSVQGPALREAGEERVEA